jgi:hypothetical protein
MESELLKLDSSSKESILISQLIGISTSVLSS